MTFNTFGDIQLTELKTYLDGQLGTIATNVNDIKDRIRHMSESGYTNNNVHFGITCNGCNRQPIAGDRFKCATCHDYNLCSSCERTYNTRLSNVAHDPSHYFIKIRDTSHFNAIFKR